MGQIRLTTEFGLLAERSGCVEIVPAFIRAFKGLAPS